MKIVTVNEMRDIERRAAQLDLPTDVLMEKAGLAVAQRVKGVLGDVAQRQILVLIGPGNNGGDGLVTARHLSDWGARVDIYLCTNRPADDPNLIKVLQRKITITDASNDPDWTSLNKALSISEAVIDAVLGTGKARPIEGPLKHILDTLNLAKNKRTSLLVVALDLPSGLDADTGKVDPSCVAADVTVTLGFPKIGLFSFPGRDFTGQLITADIGIPSRLADNVTTELITREYIRACLPLRPISAHKGTFGRVLVCAGSLNYTGAAYLACQGAVRVGAGLVTLAVARSLLPILAAKLTEVTYIPLPESDPGFMASHSYRFLQERLPEYDVILIGCGLSQNRSVIDFIRALLLEMPHPLNLRLVVDADALNTLARIPRWWQTLKQNAILTPHPGEMARLSGHTIEEVEGDRLGIAREKAAEWDKTVVLKGAHTVLASPAGETMISPVANAVLASSGTGDVLAGAIAGLFAQGLSSQAAAACGVYLHGLAGEMVSAELGDAGMAASDLLPALPRIIKRVKGG